MIEQKFMLREIMLKLLQVNGLPYIILTVYTEWKLETVASKKGLALLFLLRQLVRLTVMILINNEFYA